MSRGIHSDVITELAKDAFNMAHLVSIDFSTTLYLTDFAYDIVYSGNNYNSSAHLLSMTDVNETPDVQVGTFTINLSGVEQSFISILLGENHIDKSFVFRAVDHSVSDDDLLWNVRQFADGDDFSGNLALAFLLLESLEEEHRNQSGEDDRQIS